jgi:RNA polymerase sigma-70 factor (ECF subfamily)
MGALMGEPSALPASDDQALRALMVRYQNGEMEAFEQLYRRTLPMIRGYLASLTSDRGRTADLTQESYLQIHRSRRTYDPAFPVKPWMLGIARHVLLMDRRKRWRISREVTGFETLPEVPVPAEMEGFPDRDVLERALAGLAGDWREALVLHHVYGLSFREVGLVAGVSEGGARIRASRGMALLRETLGSRKRDG